MFGTTAKSSRRRKRGSASSPTACITARAPSRASARISRNRAAARSSACASTCAGFSKSAKILDLAIPYSLDELVKAAVETCKANKFEECYIRPILFTADGPLGVYPGPNPPVDVAIVVWEWGSYLGDKGINEGAKLQTSSFIRPHPNSIMSKGKITGQYVTGVLAKREAIANGFDEALLLDPEGYPDRRQRRESLHR